MPNWCGNTLKVIGDEKDLKKFTKKIKPKNFLSSFIPIPKELENTTSPRKGKKDLNLILKYKTDNWYDWCRINWGTKWDFEVEIDGDPEFNEIIISFDSAWSPPIEGLKNISKMYPNIIFFINYDEPGMGFKGLARIQNGTEKNSCFNY